MKVWEYRVTNLGVLINSRDAWQAALNDAGQSGWELVAIIWQRDWAFFKREVEMAKAMREPR